MTDVTLAHLYALRAHLDAVILAAEAGLNLAPVVEPGGCPTCGAPADQVSDASTLDGTRKSRCGQCAAVWET